VLTSSFCCFKGLSLAAERRLWQSGCLSWQELLLLDRPVFSQGKHELLKAQIQQAKRALELELWDYFLNRLTASESVRLLPHVLERVGYLDIETTGLSARDVVTTIALIRSGEPRCFVRGINLDNFLGELPHLSLLVTYNGRSFDLPRLRALFGIDLALPHIDLMPCLRAHGYRGGQKKCEELLGLRRPEGISQDGKEAVKLWARYEREGDTESLLRLVRYNIQDALALEILACEAYDRSMSGFPIVTKLQRPATRDVTSLTLADLDLDPSPAPPPTSTAPVALEE
jgi:uncharacterized protein